MSKRPGIYRIRAPKRISYIGRSVDIPSRWSTHRRKLRQGIHDNDMLQASYYKYGLDRFKFDYVHETRFFLARWEMIYWQLELWKPWTTVANEIRPSKGAKRWFQFWRR